jgi:hypothetical protein
MIMAEDRELKSVKTQNRQWRDARKQFYKTLLINVFDALFWNKVAGRPGTQFRVEWDRNDSSYEAFLLVT